MIKTVRYLKLPAKKNIRQGGNFLKNYAENVKWNLSYIPSFCEQLGIKCKKGKKFPITSLFSYALWFFSQSFKYKTFLSIKGFLNCRLKCRFSLLIFFIARKFFLVSLSKPWNFFNKISTFNYSDSVDILLADENMNEPYKLEKTVGQSAPIETNRHNDEKLDNDFWREEIQFISKVIRFKKVPWKQLTHLRLMHPFSIPWKHKKTVRFSDVFRG